MSFVGDLLGMDGDDQAWSAQQAAKVQADAQTTALDYLKEREEIPRQLSEQALTKLGGLAGMHGSGMQAQRKMINRAMASPLYGAIMGGQEAGEDAILRSASATGGLRSGNVQENLYDYNTQLQNQALLESYNQQLQGLQGLAGLPSNANAIAQQTSSIGQTTAQGLIGASQARADADQQLIDTMMGGAKTAFMFSDRRLKRNIKKVSEIKGHNWYTWDWNIVAQKMGLKGSSEGVIADEVYVTDPECIGFKDGFLIVNYTKLGIFPEVAHG